MQNILIDWLQFTVMDMSFFFVIKDLLKLDLTLFVEIDRGKLGYLKQLRYDNITVLYQGGSVENDMGVHVILTGQGCRLYETHRPLIQLIESINTYNGKLTRIDLALDDHTGELIKFNRMINDITLGNVVSKWKTSTEYIKRNLDGKKLGQAITVGSRTSNTFLRIYNKALEQELDPNEIWYRIELEIKKVNAQTIQNILTEKNVGVIMKGILNNYIRLLIPSATDTNKSRWQTRPYWTRLLDDAEKVTLSQKPEQRNIQQIKNWLEHQAGHSIAMVTMYEQGDLDFLYEMIRKKSMTLSRKHLNILERERELDREKEEYWKNKNEGDNGNEHIES